MTANDPADDRKEMRRREVPAVTRAVAILRALGRAEAPVGVNPLARELGLVPSTALHILRVLTDEGLVAFDPSTKRYSIDVGILAIARSAIQKNAFATLIQAPLDALSERFGATAIATQLTDSRQMVVVALSQVQLPFRLHVDLGSRFPALISATGRCFAAFSGMGEEAMRAGFDALKWDNPPGWERWRDEVERTRAAGWALDRGDYIAGVAVIAVPFFDAGGRMVRSMVAIGISERMDAVGNETVAAELLRIRDEVATQMVGAGS